MGTQIYMPPIVRNNLMIYYDAATPLCYNYNGIGANTSSFYDLSGNNVSGSVGLYYVGTNVYNPDGKGCFVWDNFNNPGRTYIPSNITSSFTGSVTVQFWIKPDYDNVSSGFRPQIGRAHV